MDHVPDFRAPVVKMQDVHIQVSWMYVWWSEAMGKLPTRPASQLDRRVEFYAGMFGAWNDKCLEGRKIAEKGNSSRRISHVRSPGSGSRQGYRDFRSVNTPTSSCVFLQLLRNPTASFSSIPGARAVGSNRSLTPRCRVDDRQRVLPWS